MAITKTNTTLTLSTVALGSILLLPTGPTPNEAGLPRQQRHQLGPVLAAWKFPSRAERSPYRPRKEGARPGDMFVSSDMPVHNASTGERIGSMDGWEIILSAHHDGSVAGATVLRLADGNVTIDGIVRHTDEPNIFAVTGGTGTYVGVSGTLTVVRENTRRKVDDHAPRNHPLTTARNGGARPTRTHPVELLKHPKSSTRFTATTDQGCTFQSEEWLGAPHVAGHAVPDCRGSRCSSAAPNT